MIDFSTCQKLNKGYNGADRRKICISYNSEAHMLKFSSNTLPGNCVSEYIGCHIYDIAGIPVQGTLLGQYDVRGSKKLVVACKDIEYETGLRLQNFGTLINRVITSRSTLKERELFNILDIIQTQDIIPAKTLMDRFWDMFIIDALIGNTDRNNDNWGFLYNDKTDKILLSPVFDCANSLFPQLSEDQMAEILRSDHEVSEKIYNIATSALTVNGRKINYHDFITSLTSEDCNAAILRIVPRINMDEIRNMITGIPVISDAQKRFYYEMLSSRKRHILDKAYSLVQNRELLTGLKDNMRSVLHEHASQITTKEQVISKDLTK